MLDGKVYLAGGLVGVLEDGLVDGRPSRQLWVFDPVTQQVHCPVVDQLDEDNYAGQGSLFHEGGSRVAHPCELPGKALCHGRQRRVWNFC